MAEIRVTEIDIVVETVNADANILVTEEMMLVETVAGGSQVYATQQDMVVAAIAGGANIYVTEIVWLNITQRRTRIFAELFSPLTGF